MKKLNSLLIALLCILAFNLALAIKPVQAQSETETLTVTQTASQTASPTRTSTATQEPSGYDRPLVTIKNYSLDPATVQFGQDADLTVQLRNTGQKYAFNLVITFSPGDLIPRGTGGVISVDEIAPGNQVKISQPLTASTDLWGKSLASLNMSVSYTDTDGVNYSEQFVLSFPIMPPQLSNRTQTPTPTATPSPSPTALVRPQLVITHYSTNVDPLEPGTQFELALEIQNLGNSSARRVTMIVGGGNASIGSGGTPDPGGVSGSSGEFTNFAPLGSSNIQSLGDLAVGAGMNVSQSLIVNVSTNPGAYPMKISFVYLDSQGATIVDDQVITLLVYSLPRIEINFYQDPGPIFAGQPNFLPLQIVNLGRKSALLGNMQILGEGADLLNNSILVGTLEMGGYYTLDATVIPYAAGPLELTITVDYTDDFNQAQKITKTITLDVLEMQDTGPMPGEGPIDGDFYPPDGSTASETFWQKLGRFLLGLLGLDSAVQTQPYGMPGTMDQPVDVERIPIPVKGP